jgi:hypothetical protein
MILGCVHAKAQGEAAFARVVAFDGAWPEPVAGFGEIRRGSLRLPRDPPGRHPEAGHAAIDDCEKNLQAEDLQPRRGTHFSPPDQHAE